LWRRRLKLTILNESMFLKFKVMSSLSKTKMINLNVSRSSFLLEKKKNLVFIYSRKIKIIKMFWYNDLCKKKIQSFGFKKKIFFLLLYKNKVWMFYQTFKLYFVKKKEEEKIKTYKYEWIRFIYSRVMFQTSFSITFYLDLKKKKKRFRIRLYLLYLLIKRKTRVIIIKKRI